MYNKLTYKLINNDKNNDDDDNINANANANKNKTDKLYRNFIPRRAGPRSFKRLA